MNARTVPEPGQHHCLRVLLFSPVVGIDPPSGDTSYTEALLANPPLGIKYTTYTDAIEDGSLWVRGRKPRAAKKWTPIDALLLFARSLELLARGAGVMFREPTWFVEIEEDAFDVVHQHLFAVAQVRNRVPVVSSAGYPLTVLYTYREGWQPWRLALAERLELWWSRLLRVHNPWLHQVRPSVMSVYSSAAERYLWAHGADVHATRVISTALPPRQVGRRNSTGNALLFVGRDFKAKGGGLAVELFRRLTAMGHAVTLTVVTDEPPPIDSRDADVTWLTDLDRSELISELLPRCDVLVAPTFSDCGAPYAVLEALQSGLAVLLSNLVWLDPRLTGPAVRIVDRDLDEMATALALMLVPATLAAAQDAAPRLWQDHFSTDELGRELRAAYDAVLQA